MRPLTPTSPSSTQPFSFLPDLLFLASASRKTRGFQVKAVRFPSAPQQRRRPRRGRWGWDPDRPKPRPGSALGSPELFRWFLARFLGESGEGCPPRRDAPGGRTMMPSRTRPVVSTRQRAVVLMPSSPNTRLLFISTRISKPSNLGNGSTSKRRRQPPSAADYPQNTVGAHVLLWPLSEARASTRLTLVPPPPESSRPHWKEI